MRQRGRARLPWRHDAHHDPRIRYRTSQLKAGYHRRLAHQCRQRLDEFNLAPPQA